MKHSQTDKIKLALLVAGLLCSVTGLALSIAAAVLA